MKRFRFWINSFFAFCLVFSSGLFAQSDNTFSFITHAGLAGSQVQGDGLGGFDKLNLQLGIGVESEMKSGHLLGLEMNLVQKGSVKNPDPENGDREKYKMSLLYIQVPIYFHYKFTPKISALTGPGLGFLVSAKEEDLNGEIDVNPEFNTFEFSAILGAQYWFSSKFRAEIRFDQSILPIRTKDTGVNYRLIGRQYNTSLGVYACYTIN